MKKIWRWIKSNPYMFCASALILFGISVIFRYLFLLSNEYEITNTNIDVGKTGAVGDFIGGFVGTIFSIAGFVFLYLTLKDQQEASSDQRKSFEKERFESRFFELLKFHRENVSNMSIELDEDTDHKVIVSGSKAIKYIYQQIMEARDEIKPFFRKIDLNDIYEPDYYKSMQSEYTIKSRDISLKEIAKLNIGYHIVFFGVDYYGKHIILNALEGKYKRSLIKEIIDYMALKPLANSENWGAWRKLRKLEISDKNNTVKNIYWIRQTQPKESDITLNNIHGDDCNIFYRDNFIKYYGGHQIRLGHYFRHFFQAINFINDTKSLTYIEKYEYVKLFRAQMSTYEQVVFYFNSLSSMGDIWELALSKSFKNATEEPTLNELLNKQLVTKYNLIKNLANGQLLKQSFERNYPDVSYEFQDYPQNRSALEKIYT